MEHTRLADGADAIVVQGLVKRYGKVTAVDGVDLTVARGSVLGLLGPNGAGKTTLIRILATLVKPDAGHASILGFDVAASPGRVRRLIGLSGQYAAVDDNLTGRENLEMIARLYHFRQREARQRAAQLLDRFRLGEAAERRLSTYSGGMRRRLDLACALVAEPPVLMLDEPTTGLDPQSRFDLWDAIRDLAAGGTSILLTTQYLEETEQLAQAVVVVDRGKVVASGTPDELKRAVGGERVLLTMSTPADRATAAASLAAASLTVGRVSPQVDDAAHTVSVAVPAGTGARALTEIVRRLDEQGIVIDDVTLRRPTLDDAFLALTHQGGPDDADARPAELVAGRHS
jgi:ABC-2 type transport system ATP-binding protein